MRFVIIFVTIFSSILFGQNINFSGKVIDSTTKLPLISANVIIAGTSIGTTTDENGDFSIIDKIDENSIFQITYVGYESYKSSVEEFLKSDRIIKLLPNEYKLQSIIVKGIIAKEGITPASFSNINRKEIEENYTIQDIPEFLSYLPSTTFYSENGNGIGYNYLSIRGFDQRRISISVNGIPQNDPEDHNLYWLDMPDLLESIELVQVQRGAGAGAIGYPSIGGSINIITSPFSDKPNFEISSSIGSYNTRKYSAKFSSGLIDKKYSIYAKLSKTLSDGYRNNSWIDFNSFHISAVRYDKNFTTQLNIFGGPVSDGLAFYGLPKEYIKNAELRITNFVLPREIENFSQPHYELLNEYNISNNLTLNNTLFLVIGEGFFDYDGSWAIPEYGYADYFRMKENGYNLSQNLGNTLIHAAVENKQWGVIPKLTWEHNGGTLITGIEYRNHRSKHWGNIRYAENIPTGVPHDYQYYYYEGGKNILNIFANENYNLIQKLNIMGEIQLSYHEYKLFNEKYLSNNISIDGLYINPRIGFNYNLTENLNAYFSFARVTREPRLKSYYDAAESSGGAVPQFKADSLGNYNFDNPLVKPETMNNFELGARFTSDIILFNTNLYYMLFNDEIVKQGQLDRFGQPVTGNVDKSIHSGIEIETQIKFHKNISFIFNGNYSKNYISKGSTFISYENSSGEFNVQEIDLAKNKISGFPELTFNLILKANYENINTQLSGKFVGKYYSDNFDKEINFLNQQYNNFIGYSDNIVEPYFVVNFSVSYEFSLRPFFNKIRIFSQVNNIFNELYASYATGADFFPAADRNFLCGIKLGL